MRRGATATCDGVRRPVVPWQGREPCHPAPGNISHDHEHERHGKRESDRQQTSPEIVAVQHDGERHRHHRHDLPLCKHRSHCPNGAMQRPAKRFGKGPSRERGLDTADVPRASSFRIGRRELRAIGTYDNDRRYRRVTANLVGNRLQRRRRVGRLHRVAHVRVQCECHRDRTATVSRGLFRRRTALRTNDRNGRDRHHDEHDAPDHRIPGQGPTTHRSIVRTCGEAPRVARRYRRTAPQRSPSRYVTAAAA